MTPWLTLRVVVQVSDAPDFTVEPEHRVVPEAAATVTFEAVAEEPFRTVQTTRMDSPASTRPLWLTSTKDVLDTPSSSRRVTVGAEGAGVEEPPDADEEEPEDEPPAPPEEPSEPEPVDEPPDPDEEPSEPEPVDELSDPDESDPEPVDELSDPDESDPEPVDELSDPDESDPVPAEAASEPPAEASSVPEPELSCAGAVVEASAPESAWVVPAVVDPSSA